MDSVSIRRVDDFGRVVAFESFIGLFTSKAYAEEAQHIPVLRAKLNEVLAHRGRSAGSHDYKEIVSAFNSFPKDELFARRSPNCARGCCLSSTSRAKPRCVCSSRPTCVTAT